MKTIALFLLVSTSLAVSDIGYNSQCRLDSECRTQTDLADICCAKLVYEAFGAVVTKRECLPKSDMESANGAYEF